MLAGYLGMESAAGMGGSVRAARHPAAPVAMCQESGSSRSGEESRSMVAAAEAHDSQRSATPSQGVGGASQQAAPTWERRGEGAG